MESMQHLDPAFIDDRGDITNIIEGEIAHVAFIRSKAGAVRANHYHKTMRQYTYVISGEIESHCCNIDDPSKKQMLLAKPGDFINTPPMLAHAQRSISDSVSISISTRPRHNGKHEEDTVAFKVIEGTINPNL